MKTAWIMALAASTMALAQPAGAADLGRGQQIYNMHCVACHGPRGMSSVPDAPNFARGERLNQPDMLLLQTVKGGKKNQPPFFGILSDQDILNALAFARTLR